MQSDRHIDLVLVAIALGCAMALWFLAVDLRS
jgi:hypothetical protein